MRSLETADGVEYGVSALAYATTVSPGANVLSIVSPTDRLPVAATLTGTVVVDSIVGPVLCNNATPGDLQALVSIASGQTIAAVTSITDPVTVAQPDASSLNCTASQGGSWTVASTQSGTWNVGTVSTVSAVTSITNPVAATQSGSWNVGVTGSVTVAQGTAANLLCTASQGGTWNVGITGTPAVSQSGTWNVGTVSTVTAVTGITNPVAATQSGTWTVGLSSAQTLGAVTTVGTITNPVGLASGANLVGKVSNGVDTSTIYNGTTALTPKFAKIQASSSGDNAVVALVSGKKIRVLRWGLTSNGAVNVKWRSNTTDVTGPRYLTQFASAGGSYCPVGIFETAAGEALNINLSAAVAVGGELVYVEV
jgi:hypothetical protein